MIRVFIISMLWAIATLAATCACVLQLNELKSDLILRMTTPPNAAVIACRIGPPRTPPYAIPIAVLNSGLCLWLGLRGRLPGTRRLIMRH
jgi:hypothetical protein